MAIASVGLSCVAPTATANGASARADDDTADVLDAWMAARLAVRQHREQGNYGAAISDIADWIRRWDPLLQDQAATLRCDDGVPPSECRAMLRSNLSQAHSEANRLSVLEVLQESLDGGDLATLDTLLPELMGVKSDSTPGEVRRVFQAVLRHEPSFQTWIEGHGPYAVEVTFTDGLGPFANVKDAVDTELKQLGLQLSTTPRTIVRLSFEGDAQGQSNELLGSLKQFSIDAVASLEPVGGDIAFEVGASRTLLGADLEGAVRLGHGAEWALKPLWAAMLNAAHRHLLP